MSRAEAAAAPIRTEQLRLVLEGVAQSAVVGGALSFVLVAVLWSYAPAGVLAGWELLFLAHRAWAVLFARRVLRRGSDGWRVRRIEGWLAVNKVLEGCVWGSLLWVGLPLQVLPVSVLLMSTMGAIGGNAVSLLSPLRHLYLALTLPISGSAVICLCLLGGPGYDALAFCCVLYLAGQYGQVVLAQRRIREAIALRFENLDLIERLQAKTEAADRAREDAERANAAKSQFLAAASHDLRQPVHALGLFIEALRLTPLNASQRRMVEQAKSAGLASTEMLNTLLDYSRLEAGVISPRLSAFPLRPLLDRLEAELGPMADAKGLAYRTRGRGAEAVLASDSGLLELILRNLVLNAIRYTERGGLLVGWRRRGASVVIEVVDTGVGIAPEQQEAVFREFHQLGNPERDRSKGLGLGLAIVRGLSTRLEHPLSLVSAEGRGTVFRLRVPLAERPDAEPPALEDGAGASPATLVGRRILVIDDDAAVRDAMLALVSSWRAEGLAAEGWREALELCPPAHPPDAVVCDYRLRGGETGARTLERLRRAWGSQPPALLITGDTAPERLRDALDSGAPLLHKPVRPQDLSDSLIALLA